MFYIVFYLFLILWSSSFAYEEIKGIVDEGLSYRDAELESIVNENLRKGKYNILLEIRLRNNIEVSKTLAEREYYTLLLLRYLQDLDLLDVYGRHVSPDNLIVLCRDQMRVRTPLERYKKCFDIHKDGRFFRGIYSVMSLRDKNTIRWMENKITEVKIHKDYAYHAMGLLYYHLGERKKAINFLILSGRLGMASLIRAYINMREYQKAKEYADRLRTYRDLDDEERETLRSVDRLLR